MPPTIRVLIFKNFAPLSIYISSALTVLKLLHTWGATAEQECLQKLYSGQTSSAREGEEGPRERGRKLKGVKWMRRTNKIRGEKVRRRGKVEERRCSAAGEKVILPSGVGGES